MAFEEEAAYAQAAWSRFDANVTDELLRAVTAAFVLVAVADGDLARAETDRFLALLRERADDLASLDFAQVEPAFADLSSALFSDPVAGRQRALELIAAVKSNAHHCELVRTAAEIALAADNRSLAAEQGTLEEICQSLALAPR